ncbi:hypothetical protein ACHAWF_001781 [Thalassiosira exigua]
MTSNLSHSYSSNKCHRVEDAIRRLDDMIDREAAAPQCANYFELQDTSNGEVDEACRAAMTAWLQQIQRTLSLNPETVWIAMSFFDRYLASGRGLSLEVLKSKRNFQLACITAFYATVNMYEPCALTMDEIIQICRGAYAESEIVFVERDMLSALDWLPTHTPLDFVRALLELLPKGQASPRVEESLVEDCQDHLDQAVADLCSTCSPPSDVGTSCLVSSIAGSQLLTPAEKRSLWIALNECYRGLLSKGVKWVTCRLFSDSRPRKPSHLLVRQVRKWSDSHGTNMELSPACVSPAPGQE